MSDDEALAMLSAEDRDMALEVYSWMRALRCARGEAPPDGPVQACVHMAYVSLLADNAEVERGTQALQ